MKDDEIKSLVTLYIEDEDMTLRKLECYTNFGKTTIHKNFKVKLKEIDKDLYDKYVIRANKNFEERTMRGGLATKLKYQKIKKDKE